MNYEKIYGQLVEKCKVRGLDKSKYEGYFEIHHIVPRCLGGSNEKGNLVMFTGREHFIAHMLLWKSYPRNKSIAYAARFMSLRTEGSRVNSKVYENLKKITDSRPKKQKSPKFKDKTGQVFGRLTVLSISHWADTWGGNQIAVWKCECSCGKITEVISKNLTQKGTKSCGCLGVATMKQPRNKKPWESTRTPERWILADEYHMMWVSLGKPESEFKFARLYNMAESTDFGKTYFKGLIPHFISGWLPSKDQDWITFREGYT